MNAVAAASPAAADLADVLFERFAGRRDAYARRGWNRSKEEWEYWTARPHKDGPELPLTVDVIKRHLTGREPTDPIGTYLFEQGGEHVRFAAVDIDNGHGDNPALPWDELVRLVRPLYDTLTKFEDVLALRSGGGKGMHLVMLFDQPVRAVEIRAHLAWVLDQCGLREDRNSSGGIHDGVVEVFPKQDHAKGGKGFANLLALPFARKSVALNADLEPLPIEMAAEVVAAVPSYVFPLPPALRGAPASRAAPSPASARKSQSAVIGGETAEVPAANVVPLAGRRGRFDTAGVMAGVEEGGRDVSLWSLASKLRASDVPQGEADDLVQRAAARMRPPIDAAEALSKVARAYANYPPNIEATDSGNAEYFTRLHGEVVRYDYTRKRWLTWAGHWWKPDVDGGIMRLAKQTMANLYRDAPEIPDAKKAQQVATHALKSRSLKALQSMLTSAQSEEPISDSGQNWDRNPWLFGVANGVIDLKTGELRPGRREDRITMHSPVKYDPDATCPRWERFLSEVYGGDLDLVRFIQRYASYSLTGSVREEMLTLHHGGGSNGKSVLLKILKAVFGDYGHTMPFTDLEEWARKRVSNEVAALAGKRLVVISEANEGAQLNAARVKSLVSRDMQRGRFLYCEPIDFEPTQHFWLAFNDAPKVSDDTNGFWRRVAAVNYAQTFVPATPDQTEPPEGQHFADPLLDEKLIAHELPGILAWAVRGCLAWQDETMRPFPAIVARATQEYRESEDEIGNWIAERCSVSEKLRCKPMTLFQSYKGWAESMDVPPHQRLDNRTFFIKIKKRFDQCSIHGATLYKGIDLKIIDPF